MRKGENMKKEELKYIMDQTLEQAKNLLLRDGKLWPVAFVHVGNDIHIIGLTFRNTREKDMQIYFLKKFVKEKNADVIFVAVESWYVTSDKKDLTIVPSKHPNRKECIFLTGESEEGDFTTVQLFERKGEEIIFTEKIGMDNVSYTKFNFGIKDRKKQIIEKKELS